VSPATVAADHANDNGECWPSIARLAERARIAPANVTRHINLTARFWTAKEPPWKAALLLLVV